MKTEYGRISLCLGVMVVLASGANAQAEKPEQDLPLPAGIEEITKIDANDRGQLTRGGAQLFALPQAVEPLKQSDIKEWHLHVPSKPSGATIGAPEYEPIESLVSIEAQMILLAKTKSGARIFAPQHLSPNFFARLFGGTIIPTRDMVAPSSE